MDVPALLMGSPFVVSIDGAAATVREMLTIQSASLQFEVEPGAHVVQVLGAEPVGAPR